MDDVTWPEVGQIGVRTWKSRDLVVFGQNGYRHNNGPSPMSRGQTVQAIAKRTTLSVRKPPTLSRNITKWMTSRDRKWVKSGFEHGKVVDSKRVVARVRRLCTGKGGVVIKNFFFALTRELRPTIIPSCIAPAPKFADMKDLEGTHRESHVGT